MSILRHRTFDHTTSLHLLSWTPRSPPSPYDLMLTSRTPTQTVQVPFRYNVFFNLSMTVSLTALSIHSHTNTFRLLTVSVLFHYRPMIYTLSETFYSFYSLLWLRNISQLMKFTLVCFTDKPLAVSSSSYVHGHRVPHFLVHTTLWLALKYRTRLWVSIPYDVYQQSHSLVY